MRKKIIYSALCIFLLSGILSIKILAEGSHELNNNDGYRPYVERYNATTAGENRLTEIYAYAKSGETIYFGTSVKNAELGYTNEMLGTNLTSDELHSLNDTDILVAYPSCGEVMRPYVNGIKNNSVKLYNVNDSASASSNNEGYIANNTMETNGLYTTTNPNGYHAFSFVAEETGVYTFHFFSAKLGDRNPNPKKTSDSSSNFEVDQKGSTVASFDVSIEANNSLNYDGVTIDDSKGINIIPGRTFTNTLFLNMGSNINSGNVLKSNVYVLTTDGFIYNIDFNGMDPYGFVFYANKRGLVLNDPVTNTSHSLYHSVKSENDNKMSELEKNNIYTNIEPFDDELDETYKIFFNTPASDLPESILKEPQDIVNTITDFKFNGFSEGKSYVGGGGNFTFNAGLNPVATTFEITLNLGENNKRVLSNTLVKGINTIHWDGKDANGDDVPAGTYSSLNDFVSLELKGGEVHFPYLDVENNYNGIKINLTNLPDAYADSFDTTKLYYNNSKYNSGWFSSHTGITDKLDHSADGVSTLNDGAMKYQNHLGDYCALDSWTYFYITANIDIEDIEIVDDIISLNKYDGVNKNHRLEASFNLFVDGDDTPLNFIYDDANNTYKYSEEVSNFTTTTITSKTDSSIIIDDLHNEKYKLVEIEAPEGYDLSQDNSIYIDFTKNNQDTLTKVVDVYNYQSDTYDYILNLNKIDADTNKLLDGAQLEIYKYGEDNPLKFIKDSNNNYLLSDDINSSSIIKSSSQDSSIIYGLENASYIIKEIKAPDGYELNKNDTTFTFDYTTVDSNRVVNKTINIKNSKTKKEPSTNNQNHKVPSGVDTSDGSNIYSYFIELLSSTSILIIILAKKLKEI